MDPGVVDSPVTLVIRAPNQKYDDQTINCYQNWTVEKLKAHLSDVYPSKPSSKDQRLVYSGKLLLDHFTLKDVLRKQDEYHMLHLVCASRTPPSSPKPPRSRSNEPRENPAGPTPFTNANVPPTGQQQQSYTGESSDGLRQQALPFPYHQMYSQVMQSWYQRSPQSYYNPLTLMWWQQLYASHYYMHYHLLATAAASSQHLRPEQRSAQSNQPDPVSQRPQADRRGNPEVQMNAQGGEILNEEELNWDWLDWVYTLSRAVILLSIVYFYSSFSRFVMVVMAMLVLHLHQAGWFPFNLENELQLPGDRANQDEMEGEPQNHDLQEMEGLMDDGSDDDGESGEDGAEDPNSGPNAGFLASTWSFIITFFMSLIPEGPQNALTTMLQYPAHWTEEEKALMKKYADLKKKKVELQALEKQRSSRQTNQHKLERNDEGDSADTVFLAYINVYYKETQRLNRHPGAVCERIGSQSLLNKPTVDPKKATEQAAVLALSGALSILRKENKKSGFKPPLQREPKKKKSKSVSSSDHNQDQEDTGAMSWSHGMDREGKPELDMEQDRERSRDRDRDQDGDQDGDQNSHRDKPFRSAGLYLWCHGKQKGNTVYVSGSRLDEDALRSTFSQHGNIIHLRMDNMRSGAFITFDKIESADQAVTKLHGSTLGDVRITAGIARQQLMLDAATDRSMWLSSSPTGVETSTTGSLQDMNN